MSNYTGVVSKLFPKSNWGTYSFGLSGMRGYYNMGKIPPFFSEGQTITFDGTPGKREGNVDVNANTIQVVTEEPVAPKDYSMTNSSGAKRTQVLQKDDYWNRKEERDIENSRRIEMQACRNTAIAFIAAAGLEAEEDGFLGLVNKYTDLFLKNNNDRLGS